MKSPGRIRKKLKNDPGFLAEAIITNNPEGVMENAEEMGFEGVASEDDIWEVINELEEDGDYEAIRNLLKVDFIEERAKPEFEEALADMAANGEIQSPGEGPRLMSTQDDGSLDTQDYLRAASGLLSGLAGGSQDQIKQPPQNGAQNTGQDQGFASYLPWIVAGVVLLVLIIILVQNN